MLLVLVSERILGYAGQHNLDYHKQHYSTLAIFPKMFKLEIDDL